MSVSIFRSGVPVCRYTDNISVDWYPCGPEYPTELGRVLVRGWYSYFMHYRAHSISRVSCATPVPLIDGIEAHSYRTTHVFHLRSRSCSRCDSGMMISFTPSNPPLRSLVLLFYPRSTYSSSNVYVYVLTLHKNFPDKYVRSFKSRGTYSFYKYPILFY